MEFQELGANMNSEEVVVKSESPQSEEQANGTDGLPGGTPNASPLAELVEQSPVGDKDEKKMKRKKIRKTKEIYVCRICKKQLPCGQALGGHMNGHAEVRSLEKMVHYEKLYLKYHQRPLPTLNPREHVSEISSFPVSNFNQPGEGSYMADNVMYTQPPQQMEPSQALYNSHPFLADSEQLDWPQASTDDFNSSGGPIRWIPNMPNMRNQRYTYNETGNATYGPAAYPYTDPSMSELTPQYSVDPNAQYDTSPCTCPACFAAF